MNQLAQVLFFFRNGLTIIASAMMMSLLSVEVVKAQPQSTCFMIDTNGEEINLADICNQKTRFQVNSSVIPKINKGANSKFKLEKTTSVYPSEKIVYSAGNGSVHFTLGTSSAGYYYGRRLIYVRRYYQTPKFRTRSDARDALLRNTRRARFSDQNISIIYRYQK